MSALESIDFSYAQCLAETRQLGELLNDRRVLKEGDNPSFFQREEASIRLHWILYTGYCVL